MRLDRVTITGAEESVDPRDLVALWRDYPFVEWGLLFGRSWGPRFPGPAWLKTLVEIAPPEMPLCAHLCSHWVRALVLDGNFVFAAAYPGVVGRVQRIQLNFHGDPHAASPVFAEILRLWSLRVQWIFQCDGVNDRMAEWARGITPNAMPLFDQSGGAGIVPGEWPQARAGIYCGYAGGLGPDTLAAELPRIEAAAHAADREQRIWIDMERAVRTPDDTRLDLGKVLRVLQAAAPVVYRGRSAEASMREWERRWQ